MYIHVYIICIFLIGMISFPQLFLIQLPFFLLYYLCRRFNLIAEFGLTILYNKYVHSHILFNIYKYRYIFSASNYAIICLCVCSLLN